MYNHAKSDVITFTVTESNIRFEIDIVGDRNDEESISGKIQKISMTILKWNIELIFDFEHDDICAIFNTKPNPLYSPSDDDDFLVRRGGKAGKEEVKNYFKSVQIGRAHV